MKKRKKNEKKKKKNKNIKKKWKKYQKKMKKNIIFKHTSLTIFKIFLCKNKLSKKNHLTFPC
jgi:hypothetical protein